jgi:hypothetical protein
MICWDVIPHVCLVGTKILKKHAASIFVVVVSTASWGARKLHGSRQSDTGNLWEHSYSIYCNPENLEKFCLKMGIHL